MSKTLSAPSQYKYFNEKLVIALNAHGKIIFKLKHNNFNKKIYVVIFNDLEFKQGVKTISLPSLQKKISWTPPTSSSQITTMCSMVPLENKFNYTDFYTYCHCLVQII